jgi:hypothetical protein
MKYGLHYIVVIGLLLSACRDKEMKDFLERYSKIIVEYPHELTDHFPHQFKTRGQFSAVTPAGAYAHDMAFFYLWIDSDSMEIADLKRRLKKVNARQFSPNDSLLIVVGDTVDYSKKINGVPIPSFNGYEKDFGLNSIRLDNDFVIYVLEWRSGEYMSKEELTTGNKFPPHLKNGFSRGLAINVEEGRILYWLTIW